MPRAHPMPLGPGLGARGPSLARGRVSLRNSPWRESTGHYRHAPRPSLPAPAHGLITDGVPPGLPASGVGNLAQVREARQPDRRRPALLVVVERELDRQRLRAPDQNPESDREPGAGPASEDRGEYAA